jgi:hypothetical protein
LVFQYLGKPELSNKGGNIIAFTPTMNGDLPNRMWALGAGQPPDQQFAWDENPFLAEGFTLLRESARSFSQTTDPDTLFDYASRQLDVQSVVIGSITADVRTDSYDLTAYDTGARCRLKIEDPWYDLEYEDVRIVDRVVNVGKEGEDHTLTFDLDDRMPPEEVGA